MKKISVTVPTYNDEKGVPMMYERLTKVFAEQLLNYDYEIIFVDDYSLDNTREVIRQCCARDKRVKAVFNAKNFGFSRNVFATMQYGTGDATFLLFSDLQDPPELLPQMVELWESGKKVIIGQRTKGNENKLMYAMRRLFYYLMDKMADSSQIEHFNGFGLYDRSFINILRQLDDPMPYLKGIVAEFGMDMSIIPYEQAASVRGRSNFNFLKNYDFAMQGITSYTKILMRLATFIGAGLGIFSAILAVFVLVSKLINWDSYPYGSAAILIGVFAIGAVQLFFLGILGEYILGINTRSMRRPLVVVGEKINFEDEDKPKEEDEKS